MASCRKLLPVPQGQRGLRQSEAVFTHVRQLPGLIEELSAYLTDCEIVAVCASRRPRDEEASYMPVFQAGDAQGRSLAALLRVPCFATTHQRGHVEAAKVDSGVAAGDLLAVHLSGGTTEVLSLVDDHLTLLGGTLDLHAGQVVDRTGVALGLPFPAGPHLEELAVRGTARALLAVAMADGGLYCHLSGAETQVQRWIVPGDDAQGGHCPRGIRPAGADSFAHGNGGIPADGHSSGADCGRCCVLAALSGAGDAADCQASAGFARAFRPPRVFRGQRGRRGAHWRKKMARTANAEGD